MGERACVGCLQVMAQASQKRGRSQGAARRVASNEFDQSSARCARNGGNVSTPGRGQQCKRWFESCAARSREAARDASERVALGILIMA